VPCSAAGDVPLQALEDEHPLDLGACRKDVGVHQLDAEAGVGGVAVVGDDGSSRAVGRACCAWSATV